MIEPHRRLSLIERAARTYDLGEIFRPREPVPPLPEPHPSLGRTDPEVIAIDRGLLAEHGMIVPGAPSGPLADAFYLVKRHLAIIRHRIVEGDDRDKARTVLVCSAQAQDGATFCAINLALSLAADRDTPVLLVDAAGTIGGGLGPLGVPDAPGLADALANPDRDVEELVLLTDIPRLSILPAGTPTDPDALTEPRAADLIRRLIEVDPRRLVLFDAPPVLTAPPAAVLATLVGQTMLVVHADRTRAVDVADAADLLEGCAHIRLVLNAASFVSGAHRGRPKSVTAPGGRADGR